MKVLVTGGSGFLGSRLVARLRETRALDIDEIRVYDAKPSCNADSTHHLGDLLDETALRRALGGVDVVFHLAALVDWGRENRSRLHAVNVEGTRRVVDCARASGVRALVYASSIDVVFTGRPIVDGDETLPYAKKPPNGYCATKAEAERLALAADDPAGLRICSVRPASIYGPRDPYHIGSLLALARRGQLFRVGRGRARSQMVYVDNVAHAMICAAAALLRPRTEVGGRAYFATDCPPANFFDFFSPVIEAAGYRMPPPEKGLPPGPLFALGAVFEWVAWIMRPVWRLAPKLTRFSVRFVTVDFTVSGARARRELGYEPYVSDEEAMRRTCDFYAGRASEQERDQRTA